MDDFSWGNTCLVIGAGSNKNVLMNEDEKYDDSMIPLKKFSGKIYQHLPWHATKSILDLQNTKQKHGIRIPAVQMIPVMITNLDPTLSHRKTVWVYYL